MDHTSKLPTETLKDIFELLFESSLKEYENNLEQLRFPNITFALGAVKMQWRQIVMESPALWTFIQLELGRYAENDTSSTRDQLLQEYIWRSGARPLHLAVVRTNSAKITTESYPISSIPLSRVVTFNLRLSPWVAKVQLDSISLVLPALEKLYLVGIDGIEIPLSGLSLLNPSLHSMAAHGYSYGRRYLGTAPKPKNLLLSHGDISALGQDISIERLNSLHMRKLVSAWFRNIPTLPGLESLVIEDSADPVMKVVFESVPDNLEGLSIRRCLLANISVMNQFAKRRGASLRFVEFVDLDWSRVAWDWILRYFSSLEELKLEESGVAGYRIVQHRGNLHDLSPILDSLLRIGTKIPFISTMQIKVHFTSMLQAKSAWALDTEKLLSFISLRTTTGAFQLGVSRSALTREGLCQIRMVPCVTILED